MQVLKHRLELLDRPHRLHLVRVILKAHKPALQYLALHAEPMHKQQRI